MPAHQAFFGANAEREKIHDRAVHCQGFKRADGLWDIEGTLVDTKAYGFDTRFRGHVAAGVPIHQMGLRLTVDSALVIRAVDAYMRHSPYPMCPNILERFQALVGLAIAPGFRRKVQLALGGVNGCTHLVELLGPIATTAFQTMAGERSEQRESQPSARPRWLDTCHAHATTSEVVRQIWPEHHREPDRQEADSPSRDDAA